MLLKMVFGTKTKSTVSFSTLTALALDMVHGQRNKVGLAEVSEEILKRTMELSRKPLNHMHKPSSTTLLLIAACESELTNRRTPMSSLF